MTTRWQSWEGAELGGSRAGREQSWEGAELGESRAGREQSWEGASLGGSCRRGPAVIPFLSQVAALFKVLLRLEGPAVVLVTQPRFTGAL